MKKIKRFTQKIKDKNIIPFTISGIMMLFAICMLLYPLISNYLANTNCSEVRAEYYETINQTNNSAVIETVTAAQEYNSSLRSVQLGAVTVLWDILKFPILMCICRFITAHLKKV